MSLEKISYKDLKLNPMTMISDEWMLVTAGTKERGFNTMTVCWGHLGALWGHGRGLPTVAVYIRPQRYTKEFIDREDYFTVSVFPKNYKKALGYLGSHSGRDGDKIAHTGLSPVFAENTTWFAEAKLALVCRKLYHAPLLKSGFSDRSVMEDNYPEHDFHTMYIGEIVEVYHDTEKE